MYRRLSEQERQARREKYRQNPIYRVVYTPLWRQRGEDLSPEDVWEEANNFAYELKKIGDENCKIKVSEKFDDLCERYSSFIGNNGSENNRSFDQAEHSAMMVSLVAFLLLANIYPEAENHPYLKICQSLNDVARCVRGYDEIYEEARQIEDEFESHGDFIEVADFIEQIAKKETSLSQSEKSFARKVFGQIVEENSFFHLDTMKDNEVILSRVNDMNSHYFQSELDLLRDKIKRVEGDDGERLEYENIVFAKEYENKIADIRKAIYQFVIDGVEHINPTEQRQWLAIIEPLKIIEGLLITHEDRPKRKKCTDGEICQQMRLFFEDSLKKVEFENIPKSISAERNKWRCQGVGLSFQDWKRYETIPRGDRKYKHLARIAIRVYGEVVKVIRR